MLKSMINLNENVDINSYKKLKSFLKLQGVGYHSKKAQTFTPENVQQFCNEASDDKFLATKIIYPYF